MNRTSPELFKSKLHVEKMYPIDPLRDGRAFIEHVVRKSELGAFAMENCSPFGTAKSRRAVQRKPFSVNIAYEKW